MAIPGKSPAAGQGITMDRSIQRAAPPGVCPFTVDRPVMRQRWERLTFLHWPAEPAAVQRLLPGGLRVDTFGGAAWVGLVPFFMRVSTPGGTALPWAGNFCETNVRTYVTAAAGRGRAARPAGRGSGSAPPSRAASWATGTTS